MLTTLHNESPLARVTLYRGWDHFPSSVVDSVATIGNFDGIHLGHQALLARLRAQSQKLGLPMTVVLFEPQPQEFFYGMHAPARLTCLREKIHFLSDLGVQHVVCLGFTRQLAELSAVEFLQRIALGNLRLRYLIVGDDFRWGYQRGGDFSLLGELTQQYGITLEAATTTRLDDARVSSTRVREALQQGDFALVHRLLGRPYTITGRVIYGAQRGRTLGFPTANIRLSRLSAPLRGVYAIKCYGVSDKVIDGIANIGLRPTVQGTRESLEVHLFDSHIDLYGRYLQVEFCQKIRDEQKFSSLDQLKQQISTDVARARAYFAK